MTIAKNTLKARNVIKGAHDIRCYSLSNNFCGAPLVDSPAIWFPTPGANGGKVLVYVSQHEFLAEELNSRNAKLTTSGALFIIRIHSNLWYEFKSTEARPA